MLESISGLIARVNRGDHGAADELYQRVYDELHRIAVRQMRGQPPGNSLQATMLVNEAYLRVFQQQWNDRAHFLATAARAMRSVLIDHARSRGRIKRRPPGERVPLEQLAEQCEERAGDLLVLDEALERLALFDERMVRLVELRFFAGLDMPDVASVLGVSLRTVRREWATARAWLRQEIR